MADIFVSSEVKSIFKDKKIVIIGDSNMRALYKDLIYLYQRNSLISPKSLKSKMEQSFFHDELVEHGKLSKGRDYVEHRKFSSDNCKISFYFITKVYSSYVEKILTLFEEKGSPDVILLNSSLWDICRWGPRGVEAFRENLKILMKRFNEVLDEKCMVIWVTTPPVSQEMKGGFLIEQLEFLSYSLRYHIAEANTYARRVVVHHGYDIVDAHYHLQMQLGRRAEDGIHWVPLAMRHITNMILTHICLAWAIPLPHRYEAAYKAHKMTVASAKLQNSETDGSNMQNPEQDAPPDGNEILALKDIKNEKESFVRKPSKKMKSKKGFDQTYHGYQQRNRLKQAHRNIHGWNPNPAPLLPPQFLAPMGSHGSQESLVGPYPSPSVLPSPYYAPGTQQPYSFPTQYYQQYAENSPPRPYVFQFAQPQFNWSDMRQIQFGQGPMYRHPR